MKECVLSDLEYTMIDSEQSIVFRMKNASKALPVIGQFSESFHVALSRGGGGGAQILVKFFDVCSEKFQSHK
jgi:hypothetical protein